MQKILEFSIMIHLSGKLHEAITMSYTPSKKIKLIEQNRI